MNRSDYISGKPKVVFPTCRRCDKEFPFKDVVDTTGQKTPNGGSLCMKCAREVSNNGHYMYGLPGTCLKCSRGDRTIRCPKADETYNDTGLFQMHTEKPQGTP